jgi:hypothetical protein
MTCEAAILRRMLDRVAFRVAVRRAVDRTARIAAALALAVLGWALATMIIPIPLPSREVAIAACAGLAFVAATLTWRLRPPPLAAARVADRRLELADRLSTATELLAQGEPSGIARLQIADAARFAEGVIPRLAAPISIPREAWIALAAAAAVACWAQFLAGWVIPGLPAARHLAVIHREGRTLVAIGRQLDASSRALGLPEARRAAPGLLHLGDRLQGPRVTRQDALRLLQDARQQLQAGQSRIERHLGGLPRNSLGAPEARVPGSSPADSGRLHQTIKDLEALTGQLRSQAGTPQDDIAQRLGTISQSLNELNAPLSVRRDVAAARRELLRGRSGSAAGALGDALQDLEGLERMLGDDQALGEAKRQVEKSAERIAQGGPLGTGQKVTEQSSAGSGPPPQAPGPNPAAPSPEEGLAPPPGPNQGSLPGQGRGGRSGVPTARLGGTRTEQHLTGRQGEGSAVTRDLLAPGRVETPQLPATRAPADVAHQNDRALTRDVLPPAYLTLIRRYFQTIEQSK